MVENLANVTLTQKEPAELYDLVELAFSNTELLDLLIEDCFAKG